MFGSDAHKVDEVLAALQAGQIDHHQATDQLFDLIYNELRRQASRFMKRERAGHTLQTTALVHEAYLNLMRGTPSTWESRAHFLGIASRAMRQVLVDHARRRGAEKRGGAWDQVTLEEGILARDARDVEIIALDEALSRFAEQNERMARTAELHIFSGLRFKDIALVLDVSLRTVQGDWRVAKMWLGRELSTNGA